MKTDTDTFELTPVTTADSTGKEVVIYQPEDPGTKPRNVTDWALSTAGKLVTTEAEKKILYAPINEEDIEIRPDGLIYLPWMEYATRLRQAFGLQWSLVEVEPPKIHDNLILWKFCLIIRGVYCGTAIGEQEYSAKNKITSWGDACEGAKSNALMRLCKGIGIGLELWQPQFIKAWLAVYAEYDEVIDGARKKKRWRKKPDDTKEKISTTSTTKPGKSQKQDDISKDTEEIVFGQELKKELIEDYEGTEVDASKGDTKAAQIARFIAAVQAQKDVLKDCDALAVWDAVCKKHGVVDGAIGDITDREKQKAFYVELSTLATDTERVNKALEKADDRFNSDSGDTSDNSGGDVA